MKIIASLVVIFVLSTIGFFIEYYKYSDCKKVGHTSLYCVLNMAK